MLRSVQFTDPLRTQTGSSSTIARLSFLYVQLDGYGYVTAVHYLTIVSQPVMVSFRWRSRARTGLRPTSTMDHCAWCWTHTDTACPSFDVERMIHVRSFVVLLFRDIICWAYNIVTLDMGPNIHCMIAVFVMLFSLTCVVSNWTY